MWRPNCFRPRRVHRSNRGVQKSASCIVPSSDRSTALRGRRRLGSRALACGRSGARAMEICGSRGQRGNENVRSGRYGWWPGWVAAHRAWRWWPGPASDGLAPRILSWLGSVPQWNCIGMLTLGLRVDFMVLERLLPLKSSSKCSEQLNCFWLVLGRPR
jgi:hypothetical protein